MGMPSLGERTEGSDRPDRHVRRRSGQQEDVGAPARGRPRRPSRSGRRPRRRSARSPGRRGRRTSSSKPTRTRVISASTQTASTRRWLAAADGRTHTATPELVSRGARSSRRPSTTGLKPLTVVIVLCSPRSTLTQHPQRVGRELGTGRAQQRRVAAGAGDQDDEAARRAGRRGASRRPAQVALALRDPAGGVEQHVDRPRRGVHVAAHERDVEVVAHRPHGQRRGGGDGHLELRAVGVRRDARRRGGRWPRCAGSRRTAGRAGCRPSPTSASGRAAGRRPGRTRAARGRRGRCWPGGRWERRRGR